MIQDNADELMPIIRAAREERDRRSPHWRAFRNELVGVRWRRGTGTKRVTNDIYAYYTTMMPVLAYRDPDVKLKSRFGEMGRLLARVYEHVLRGQIVDSKLLEVLRLGIFDSFYSVGCFKTGLAPKLGGGGLLVPFVEAVSPFRMLWDDTAKDWRKQQILGQEMSLLVDEVKLDPRYDLSQVDWELVQTSRDRPEDAQGDDTRGKSRDDLAEEMPPMVDLVELYLQDIKKMVTLLKKGEDQFVVIRSEPFYGRPTGCYHWLGYVWASDTVMPIAPSHGWWEQHLELEEQEVAANEQMRREQTVVGFPSGAGDAARIISEAKTHSIVTNCDHMGQEVTYGGYTETRRIALADKRQQFQKSSGLTDIKQGMQTSPSETATSTFAREKYGNLSTQDMQFMIRDAAAEILKDYLFYSWNDENVQQPVSFAAPDMTGTNEPIDMVVQGGGDPAETGGMTDADLVLEIKKDSMLKADDPVEKSMAMQEIGLVLGPLAQTGMMSGYMINFPNVLKWCQEKFDRDDYESLFIPATPLAMMMSAAGQAQSVGPGQVQQAGTLDKTTMAMSAAGGNAGQKGGEVPGSGGSMSRTMRGSPMMKSSGMGSAELGVAMRPPRSPGNGPSSSSRPKGT